MRWLASELHTHTFHSDGRQSLRELAEGALRLGFECIALTDHNTMSGLADKQKIEQESDLVILPGMEWTTFFGHMVTIGQNGFADWRRAIPQNIAEGTAEVRALGGVAGLAHPYRIGSPACTGCFWEFEISDWSAFDYIEVWSGTFAPVKSDNKRAYELWTARLNAGDRIAAVSGRDWHVQSETLEPVSVTYLGLADESGLVGEQALQALRSGRASVTLGPLVTLEVETASGMVYRQGDAIPRSAEGGQECRANVELSFTVRQGLWELPPQSLQLVLTGSNGVVAETSVAVENGRLSLSITSTDLTWLRAELYGVVQDVRTLIAFTNAVYFD